MSEEGSDMPSRICQLVAALAACVVVISCPAYGSVELAHLNNLKGTVHTPAGPLPVWYIYAEPTPAGYRPVGAAGEGVACVDDVARALLVYVSHFELTGDASSLAHARDAVRFLAALRRDDGTYVNFIHADGTLNETGPTSRPGVNWWMARAMWGLARARYVFTDADPAYAAYLDELLRPSVDRLMAEVPLRPGQPPEPRIVGGGADVSAIFLLAVSWLYLVEPDPALEPVAAALARGLLEARSGSASDPPYGVVMPNPGSPSVWTGWGHHALEALALAGAVFGNAAWLEAAADIAHSFATYLVAGPGALAAQGPAPIPYPQIAYDVAPLVRGLVTLYEATGSDLYADLAFLAGSWLYDNNPANERMFLPETGAVYDGIDGDGWHAPGRVNYNAGAESTVEGLSILLALEKLQGQGMLASADLRYVDGAGPIVVEAEEYERPGFGWITLRQAAHLDGSRPSGGAYVLLQDGSEIALPVAAPPGTYRVHLIHGGARTRAATVYIVSASGQVLEAAVPRSRTGDRLLATDLGLLQLDKAGRRLHIFVADGTLAVDAVLLHPEVLWRRLRGADRKVLVLRSMADGARRFGLPGAADAVQVHDAQGRPVPWDGETGHIELPPLGFAIAVYER